MKNKLEQVTGMHRAPAFKGKGFFVYFLYLGDVVVYVGATTDINTRILSHAESIKEFDSYSVIPMATAEEMFELELRGIVKYTPRYNKTATATEKSGFRSASNIKLWHDIDAETIKEMADAADIEVLEFKGKHLYNTAQINRLLGITA